MDDRFEYAKVRQKIIDMLRVDLLGPSEENEVLDEKPQFSYIVGMLAPQSPQDGVAPENEQEVDTDIAYEDDTDFTAGEDDDNEPVSTTRFKTSSSIGISFYIKTETPVINIDVSWGDYTETKQSNTGEDGKKFSKILYVRQPMKETVRVKFSDFDRSKEYSLVSDSNICVHITRMALKNGYALITAYLVNRRTSPAGDLESMMFQVNIRAYSPDESNVFIAEHICRDVLAPDEYYYAQRPILGRGRGCAATWGEVTDGKTFFVQSDFIPEYEIPGVSPSLPGFYFSMAFFSIPQRKSETIDRLTKLASSYEEWIHVTLSSDTKMSESAFRESVGNPVIEKCQIALSRIREGITLLESDDIAYDAFCFMNRVMLMQNSIKNYSKKHGSGVECNFADFTNYKRKDNDFGWYPFQIAFILMNLKAIVDPTCEEREIVDLLYFPTGGGKTEAYLGLMAFTIANRRLRARDSDEMNRDGGVTIILRYTLRLLTTQQRDRITRMILAAELIRSVNPEKYGKEPISIGFWVGSGVTPNKFKDLENDSSDPEKNRKAKTLIYKQLPTCPFCGIPLQKEDFYICTETESVTIYCGDKDCLFYKYRQDKHSIPVYLVDQEIYEKCPTVILSTVDKFAALPWTVETNTLFGRVDRYCSRHGYVAIGDKHEGTHRKKGDLIATSTESIKPFLPPELIIQDELHLITGPLGTVYGAYETLIEDMCTYTVGGKKIKPKYIVSTATIKNAEEQAKCLYARKITAQFPPNGFEIGDSFFVCEMSAEKYPYRKYVGISAPGQSVKTALLRIYAIILQYVFDLSQRDEYKDLTDPYYTLVGYFNSIRELGGAARLLQDDIPKRIKRIVKNYHMDKRRCLYQKIEITSRMSSYRIPENLQKLETPMNSEGCLDTAIATNMIAVGMDIDRLGLMVVDGQPKQNSEYIQATSRIGRKFPGLVVSLYNPYRPRDLSHYENFTGYHAQLYRFVEGTTATPFSARARDRVMHALVIAAIRLQYPEMAPNDGAAKISELSDQQIREVKELIFARLNIVKPSAKTDAEEEIDIFINKWKEFAGKGKELRYYVFETKTYNRLMNTYGEDISDGEYPTLRSMRDVEKAANMFYYTED